MQSKHKKKFYLCSGNKITENNVEVRTNGRPFFHYLDTVTKEDMEDSRGDVLQDSIIDGIFKDNPSDIDIDYKKAYYKIQLNKTDWDKIFDADNKPIDYKAMDDFIAETNNFYA